ncbi:MAG: hypothetical protein ACLSVD_04235 [Eggerthellaceae bacterium]
MEIINFFVNLLRSARGYRADHRAGAAARGYSPLFLIVFVETGLVLPVFAGRFACCSRRRVLCRRWRVNARATLIVPHAAAILGNTSNYWIARGSSARASSIPASESAHA